MADTAPARDKSNLCLNCQIQLTDESNYCFSCGQKNTSGRLTVRELFSQFFDNVFNLESKIFRTLAAVFVPGKLTNAFLSGQRQKYYHPIRLFLVTIVFFLAGLSYNGDFNFSNDLSKEQIDRLKERKKLMAVLDDGINSISKNSDEALVIETLDTLSNIFYSNSGKRIDSINVNGVMKITDDFDFYIALEDIGKYTAEEILDLYKVEGFYERLMIQQKIKMLEEETSFVSFLLGKITWSVFFVLLLLTLIFRVLYFKSNFLYLEHLIFGIHLNTFFFVVISIFNFLLLDVMGDFMPWVLLIMAIYLFLAMWRVYKQSVIVTSLKFIIAFVCYFFSFIFGTVLTVIGSFLIF